MDGSGLGVAIVTPFDEDGSLDTKSLEKLIQHLLKGPVNYVVALGTTGEAVTQTLEEKIQFLEAVYAYVNQKVPIVIGAGGYDTRAILKEMEVFAQRFPVSAFLSVTPYYNKPNAAGLYAHYATLARNAPAPIIMYNVPVRTGVNLPPDIVVRLAWDFPQSIIGIKEASLDLVQGMEILRQAPPHFQIISGDDALTLPAMSCGYRGVISVLGNAFPSPMFQLVQAVLNQEWEKARTLHFSLLPLMRLCFAEGNPASIKGMLSLLGITQPYVRLPLVPASENFLRSLESTLKMTPHLS